MHVASLFLGEQLSAAGRHLEFLLCRELITSEIVYWLYQVLTGKDAEFTSWPAAATFASERKKMRLGASSLQDWVQDLLKKVVFKVSNNSQSFVENSLALSISQLSMLHLT